MRISDWSSDVCSSDLDAILLTRGDRRIRRWITDSRDGRPPTDAPQGRITLPDGIRDPLGLDQYPSLRSEEHTSELQSLMRISYAVFCLKKTTNPETNQNLQSTNNNNTRTSTIQMTTC